MSSGVMVLAVIAALAAGIALGARLRAGRRGPRDRFLPVFKTIPSPLALSRLDDGRLVAVNDRFTELTGLDADRAVGRTAVELGVWPDPGDRTRIQAEIQRGEVVREREVRLRRADGQERIVLISASRVELDGVPHLLSFARDVTEERAAALEQARLAGELQRAEERNRAVLRSLPVVQWVLDRDGVFTHSEGQGLAAFGLRPGDVVGRNITDVYAAFPETIADFRRALAGESFATENVFGPVVFESRWAPMRDADGRIVGVTGLALDVTARRRAEQAHREGELKVQVLERLATMGRAAAGLAHEVNNPLTYVLGNLEAAVERLPAGEVRDLVADAREGAERVRRIATDLAVFASARPQAGAASDVEAVVRSAVAFARNDVRHRARLEVEVEPGCRVALAEGRLGQVLVNLLSNACDAIPEGHAADNVIGVRVRAEGGQVVIAVSDTGAGMTPEVQARVFEPFFTTGGGLGVGLPLVRGMVVEAGGDVTVESAPGRGARSACGSRRPGRPPRPSPRRPPRTRRRASSSSTTNRSWRGRWRACSARTRSRSRPTARRPSSGSAAARPSTSCSATS
ncbi:MAG: PAS domain S-box protein [Anaeromyxobacter sp.]